MTRTRSALSVLAVVGVLALMGCSSDSDSDDDDDDAATTIPQTTAEATTTEVPETEAPTTEAPEAPETTLPAPETTVTEETEAPAEEPATSAVTVTVAGADTVINPDRVYCSGEEGSIRHIIGKTSEQPPLAEATPGGFAMVKLDQSGAPYKSENAAGITFADDSATFDGVVLGEATVSGTLVCTDWQG